MSLRAVELLETVVFGIAIATLIGAAINVVVAEVKERRREDNSIKGTE
jgi:hypothetical protein